MGEGRYRTLLCLVQVAVPARRPELVVEVLDPLDDSVDPAPLAAVLADPEVEIVMHAARQDVALLRRTWHTEVRNLFDTQLAAGFAGLRAQLGYEALLCELLGVRLRKSASFTRWDARPLSDEQIDYAREDVLHLLQVADALQERLGDRDRLDWAREECRPLEAVTDERDVRHRLRAPAARQRPRRARSARSPASSSTGARRPRAARIARHRRCSTTRRSSRSRSDARATRRPLWQIRGVNEPTLRRRGAEILDAVDRGRAAAADPARRAAPAAAGALDAPLIALGEALVRTRAMEARARLRAHRRARGPRADHPRASATGPRARRRARCRAGAARSSATELLELLAGRRSLRVGESRAIDIQTVP